MQVLKFAVQGSQPEPYKILVEYDGARIGMFCSCPAGENGSHCKHRVGLLLGTKDGLVAGEDDVGMLATWLPGTMLEAALAELVAAEQAAEAAKRRLAKAKKNIAAVMLDRD